MHIGKESNNLEQTEVLGVQEGDYVRYGGSNLEQLIAHKEKILLAEPKDVKKFGVSRQTLFDVKRAIQSGNSGELKSKTVRRLLAYINVFFHSIQSRTHQSD